MTTYLERLAEELRHNGIAVAPLPNMEIDDALVATRIARYAEKRRDAVLKTQGFQTHGHAELLRALKEQSRQSAGGDVPFEVVTAIWVIELAANTRSMLAVKDVVVAARIATVGEGPNALRDLYVALNMSPKGKA